MKYPIVRIEDTPEVMLLRVPFYHNHYPERVARYCTCLGESKHSPRLCPIHLGTTPWHAAHARVVLYAEMENRDTKFSEFRRYIRESLEHCFNVRFL